MRKMVLVVAAVLALAVWVSPARATSPCCSPARNAVVPVDNTACNQATDSGTPGCVETDDNNCVGGGPVAPDPANPTKQSLIGGCICIDGHCASDGSLGAGPAEATAAECSRDAATGCQLLGASHYVAP